MYIIYTLMMNSFNDTIFYLQVFTHILLYFSDLYRVFWSIPIVLSYTDCSQNAVFTTPFASQALSFGEEFLGRDFPALSECETLSLRLKPSPLMNKVHWLLTSLIRTQWKKKIKKPCNELKIQNRYSKMVLASDMARAPNSHVRPSRHMMARAVQHCFFFACLL